MSKLNIQSYMKEIEEPSNGIIELVNELVEHYCKQLDECIDEVKELLKNKDDLTIDQLNYYIAYIPVLLYSISDAIQDLGISGDIAKTQKKETFSEEYLNAQVSTVMAKTSVATQNTKAHTMIEDAYVRAYKKTQNRMEMAQLLHGSLKKILQWRIAELEVTRTNTISNNIL